MIKSIIVAVSKNDVIGKEGGLPWYLPAELARFKKITMGYPIIMGRVTHESIGRALPGRQNIIITHDKDYEAPDCTVVHSLDAAIKAVKSAKEIFFIGGSKVYVQALPIANKVYLTRVLTTIEGDKFFKFDHKGWRLDLSEKHPRDDANPFDFEFQVWNRK
jgi:dihydrofolate reductase